MVTVYKVVQKNYGIYENSYRFYSSYTQKNRLEYKLFETTYPKIGKLFACSDIESCKNWVQSRIVLRCLAPNIQLCKNQPKQDKSDIDLYWDNKLFSHDDTTFDEFLYNHFPGCIVTDWLMPIEVIK